MFDPFDVIMALTMVVLFGAIVAITERREHPR